jgi:transglutaminase-like putative cysteine protease
MKRLLLDLSLLLVIALVPAQAIAVVNPVRGLSLRWLTWIVLLAIGVGAWLGSRHPRDRRVAALTLGGGILGVLALTLAVMPDAPPDATVASRVVQLVGEGVVWFQAAVARRVLVNDLLFFLLCAQVAWVLGFVAGRLIARRRMAWLPVAAGIILLALILTSYPQVAAYAPVQLVAAVALLGRQNPRPPARGADPRERSGLAGGEGLAGLALAAVLVLASWIVPISLTAQGVAEAATAARDDWRQLSDLSIVHLRTSFAPDSSGFGTITFHGAFHLSDNPVLRIVSPRPALWRAVAYDTYDGAGWTNSPSESLALGADAELREPATAARALLVQQVTVLAARGSYLVGAANPLEFDLRSTLQAHPVGAAVDLLSARVPSSPGPSATYTVTSSVSTATAGQLRADGTSYPAEITTHYLPLPSTLPSRVRRLARRLTARQSDPYDEALAIEAYLKTLTYSEDVPAPPPGRDGVDYFLFQTRAGYCDYFASAMAVMLRSAGVPARVVSGYATGDVQPDGSYLIRDASAHSWVEVYFPAYGWIPFDPTPGFSDPPRGPQNAPPPSSNPPPAMAGVLTETPILSSALHSAPRAVDVAALWADDHPFPLLAGLAGGGVLVGLGAIGAYLWRREPLGAAPPVAVYARMVQTASVLGFGPRAAETPREYARVLAQAVPEASEGIDRIATEYASFVFGRRQASSPEELLGRWRVVRGALVRRALRLPRRIRAKFGLHVPPNVL